MATFRVLETSCSKLWDFGWFDLTRFAISGPPSERADAGLLLQAFFADPLSQCSFCDPTGWGESGRHGPFFHGASIAQWFRSVSHAELSARVKQVLEDTCTEPPSPEQQAPVHSWLDRIRARGDDALELVDTAPKSAKVEWAGIWTPFREFASVNPGRDELTIAVVGYD